jgi:hypothetical protein
MTGWIDSLPGIMQQYRNGETRGLAELDKQGKSGGSIDQDASRRLLES